MIDSHFALTPMVTNYGGFSKKRGWIICLIKVELGKSARVGFAQFLQAITNNNKIPAIAADHSPACLWRNRWVLESAFHLYLAEEKRWTFLDMKLERGHIYSGYSGR